MPATATLHRESCLSFSFKVPVLLIFLLREARVDEDDIDLDNVMLSHYRLSKIKQQDLRLKDGDQEYALEPGEGAGSGRPKDPKEEFLSQIVARLNEIFLMDELTDKDVVSFAHTVVNKVSEDERAMEQYRNNTREQVMLGDFPKAVDDAVIGSGEAQRNQMMQLLSDPDKAKDFTSLIYDLMAFEDKR